MIIAVDFDGVLCEDKFPAIGMERPRMIDAVRRLIRAGHEVILWTSRVDRRLEEALKWCDERGLDFCAVNENAPSNRAQYEREYPNGTRKVYADVYIDDHSLEWLSWNRQYGMVGAESRALSLIGEMAYYGKKESK